MRFACQAGRAAKPPTRIRRGAPFAPVSGMTEAERITPAEVKRRLDSGEAVAFVDARSPEAWEKAELQIPKSIRLPPDSADAHVDDIPKRGLIVPYCT